MAYELLWNGNEVAMLFSEELSNEDLINALNEINFDERFPAIKYELANFDAVKTFPIDTKTIKIGAEMDARAFLRNPHIKVGIIAEQLVVKGLTNMFIAYFNIAANCDVWEFKIFDRKEDDLARQWFSASVGADPDFVYGKD